MLHAFIALALHSQTPLDIRQFGAVGDGKTMCTAAIQKAIDQAGHGTVLIPPGRYLSGTLRLRSHVELNLQEGATLLGSTKRADYEKQVWYSLIIAKGADGVAITGKGTIDGQGAEVAQDVLRMVREGLIKIPPKGWRPSETERPQILEFDDCKNVHIAGVTIKNSCCWVQTYRNCVGLDIEGIKVDSKTYWNNDGIDVLDCRKVKIADCDIDADDDGICLKSDVRGKACDDVSISNCKIRSSASALKFGTSSHGGFKHIRVDGLDIRNTFRSAVALESVDGAVIEDVLIQNVKAVHTGNAFFIRLGHRTTTAPPGVVRHIVLRNFDVQVPAGRPDPGYPFKGPQFSEPHNICPSSISGLVQAPVVNVLLDSIHIHMPGGGNTGIAHVAIGKVPERVLEYPEFTMFGELPAWALYARHVVGLRVMGFEVTSDAPDYRPAFVADDVQGLMLWRVNVSGADKRPTLLARKCRSLAIDRRIRVKSVR